MTLAWELLYNNFGRPKLAGTEGVLAFSVSVQVLTRAVHGHQSGACAKPTLKSFY